MKGPITDISLNPGMAGHVELKSIINQSGELKIPDLITTNKDNLSSDGNYTVIVAGSFPYTLYFFRNTDQEYLGQFNLDSYGVRDVSIQYDQPTDKIIVFLAL